MVDYLTLTASFRPIPQPLNFYLVFPLFKKTTTERKMLFFPRYLLIRVHLTMFEDKKETAPSPTMGPTRLVSSLTSVLPRRFLVIGNAFGNPKSQMLQKMQIAPNMANPSHQFPTQRLSSTVSEVCTPSSTNIERNFEIITKPTAEPETVISQTGSG